MMAQREAVRMIWIGIGIGRLEGKLEPARLVPVDGGTWDALLHLRMKGRVSWW